MIRYPTKDDVSEALAYINKISAEQTFITFQGEQLTLGQETEYLNKKLELLRKGRLVMLYAFSDGRLIAVSDIELKEKVEKHIGDFGITVGNDFRGDGVGSILMEKVLDEALKNLAELVIVTLGAFSNNPIALAMYEKFGFQKYGLLEDGFLHKGKYVGHIHMFKRVRN